MRNYILLFLTVTTLSCSQDQRRYSKAREYYDKGQYVLAIKEAEHIHDKKLFCDIELLLGLCYQELGGFPEALKHLQNYSSKCNQDLTFHINIGDIFFKLEKADSAYAHFEKAYKIDPTNHTVNYNLGLINYTSSYDQEAIYYFNQAIKYAPEMELDYYDRLIDTYLAMEKYDSAITVVNRGMNARSTNINDKVHFMLQLAFINGAKGNYEECISQITSTLKTSKLGENDLFSAYYNRYLAYSMLKDCTNACADYNEVKKLNKGPEIEDLCECE